MNKDRSNSNEFYSALINESPIWIDGENFHCLNYGKNYSSLRGGMRKIGIVSNRDSYLSLTPESGFPDNMLFNKREANMALTEASHAGNFKIMKISLSLEDAIRILEERKAISKN